MHTRSQYLHLFNIRLGVTSRGERAGQVTAKAVHGDMWTCHIKTIGLKLAPGAELHGTEGMYTPSRSLTLITRFHF